MPRENAILQSDFPYSISARCINREWFDLPMAQVWEIMCEQLYFSRAAFDAEILAFVLMSNHFHLLMRTPHANLSKIMAIFMRETSRQITKAAHRINQTWGQRHYRCVLRSHHYYLNSYKYAYYNPVKAGLCQRVEQYPYSTLNGLLGHRKLLIPVTEDLTLFSDVEGTLDWMNRTPLEDNWATVGLALKRPLFKLPKNRDTKKPHDLEIDML
jgi:putative transposase